MIKKEYTVEGMSCSACSVHVEKSIEDIQGVSNITVSLLHNSLSFNYDENEGELDEKQIIERIKNAGYSASAVQKDSVGPPKRSFQDDYRMEKQARKRTLLTSIAFSVPLVYIAMGDMLHLPMFAALKGSGGTFSFAFVQFLLALCVLFVNQKTLRSGIRTLLKRKPTMDSLIAIGSLAAMAFGVITLFQISFALYERDLVSLSLLRRSLYFESSAMILTFVLTGKYLEFLAKGRASRAIEKLLELQSDTASVLRDGKEVQVKIEEVTTADVVVVRPGGRFPVDGIIIKGETSVDESSLSGESLPVDKSEGSTVFSSTVNTTGYVQVRPTRVGKDTTFSQIVQLVEQASTSKAPIAKLADTISLYFVPIVILLAVITTLVWLFASSSVDEALAFGISVLVISCPCALGLATPTAVMVAMGKAGEKGILIRQSQALQTLAKVDTIVFDKTRTITKGNLLVKHVLPAHSDDERAFLSAAASVENNSEHPIAKAILNHALAHDISIETSANAKSVTGKGIEALIKGIHTFGGTDEFLLGHSVVVPQEVKEYEKDGNIVVHFGQESEYIGSIVISDTLKESSAVTVENLKKRGYRIIMLTGDSQQSAQAVAQQVNIDEYHARVLPDGKERIISSLQNEGRVVAMVGDGVNDAPSLMRADVGIALHGSSDIAVESGDILLVKDDLSDVVTAIDLSRRTMRIIKENLFWALFYNVTGIPLAAGVFYPAFAVKLSPMFAAFAMSLSSIFVVTNALRLKRDKKETVVIKEGKNMNTKELNVNGMMCDHCVSHVKKALESIGGCTVTVSLEDKRATVTSESHLDDDLLRSKVAEAGYEVTSITGR
ncbi:MAG: heavy metal translocating P-type ATPase [Sphaerochaetaceae bacterium]|nr:heavy metal translocating P-type ATPase [Sphaerochaetaceae bacterium]